MISGTYSALSGMRAKTQSLEIISNNLANQHTTGYKKDRANFATVFDETVQLRLTKGVNFSRVSGASTHFDQATLSPTGRSFDLALNGEGFFKVLNGEEVLLSRVGRFDRSPEGQMVTPGGQLLLDADDNPINIPEGPLQIDEQGRIFSQEGELGRIGVFDVDQRSLLEKRPGSMFAAPEDLEVFVVDTPIVQGSLEGSNVSAIQEMTAMMDNMRVFEALNKVIKKYGEMNSKLDEIGSL